MVVQPEAVVAAPKAKHSGRPIAQKYREGRMKKSRVGSERVKVQESTPTGRTRIETRTKETSAAARRGAMPWAAGDREVAAVGPERQ